VKTGAFAESNCKTVRNWKKKELHELVAASSISALHFGVDVELLADSPLFDKAKSVVDSIKVVNDSAEICSSDVIL